MRGQAAELLEKAVGNSRPLCSSAPIPHCSPRAAADGPRSGLRLLVEKYNQRTVAMLTGWLNNIVEVSGRPSSVGCGLGPHLWCVLSNWPAALNALSTLSCSTFAELSAAGREVTSAVCLVPPLPPG